MLDPLRPARPVDCHLQSFTARYEYPVYFTRDAFDPANLCLQQAVTRIESGKRHRIAVFVDEGVLHAVPTLPIRISRYADAHATATEITGEIVVVPGGEAVKNQHDCVEHILRELSARRIDRQSLAMAIGGGAVLDAVGFAATIFHRGVRHIRFPTTVLAQDDSGVGVKNGINGFGYKNLLGTFAPPFALTRYVDLEPALAALRTNDAGGEWRVHCHVPIFLEKAGAFDSTQMTLRAALACVRANFVAPHLEVTWDVLPPELRKGDRAHAIARELEWVIEELR